MSETSLKPVIDKLENLFSKFNEKFYNRELQKAIITVSPDTTKGAYGWCTAWKAWSNQEPKKISDMKPEEIEAAKSEGFYEINICAEYLARPFEQICETLLHEMVHLYNLQIGVQDTSRSGTYHNKKYKEAADSMDITEEDLKYLRDIAEQEAVNRFTTAEISVDMSGMQNNISNGMDLDGVISGLTEGVNEAIDSMAEGVHD